MLGWTGSGQKSNLCQGFVQALSRLCPRTKKYRVCPAHDQAWSTVCQASAHFHTPWTGFGHRHPEFVQALSNKLRKLHFSSLDKLWTNFGPGKPSSGFTSPWFGKIITAWQSLDNLWTWTNPGHSLDFCSSASKLCIPPIFTRQKLDSPWTWTNPVQSLYLWFSAPKH